MDQTSNHLLEKALAGEFLSAREGEHLFNTESLVRLMAAAHTVRQRLVPGNEVGWIIDRNINITNICISGCRFCNFSRKPGDADTYITSLEEYDEKIAELFALGGRQVLLQGGMHPELGLDFYTTLFKRLKKKWPELKLHALGPPEIVHLARMEGLNYREVLEELIRAGLDSLPGAGAEILSDRVRKIVSPGKCSAQEWLDVMMEAHKLNLPTSATMMFGHAETLRERMEHLVRLREVQAAKPKNTWGFVTFVPWTFQDEGTCLKEKMGITCNVTASEYIKMLAISRLMLPNISHIQASWLTVGPDTAQICLYAGADDLGSVMMEENVVSSAGAHFRLSPEALQHLIRTAGFIPRYRNQKYETDTVPLNSTPESS